jgi:hypothetical protein
MLFQLVVEPLVVSERWSCRDCASLIKLPSESGRFVSQLLLIKHMLTPRALHKHCLTADEASSRSPQTPGLFCGITFLYAVDDAAGCFASSLPAPIVVASSPELPPVRSTANVVSTVRRCRQYRPCLDLSPAAVSPLSLSAEDTRNAILDPVVGGAQLLPTLRSMLSPRTSAS